MKLLKYFLFISILVVSLFFFVELDSMNIVGDVSNLEPNCSERVHLEAEVAKLAYRNRDSMIADPKFFDLNYDHFFSDSVVNSLVSKISSDQVLPYHNTQNYSSHKDTVYLTVVDKDRNCVSFINFLFFEQC